MDRNNKKKSHSTREEVLPGKETALKNIPAMIHAINTAGEIIDVSDLWLLEMGYEREEVMGR
jgi:PAS domain S-box-containing protein